MRRHTRFLGSVALALALTTDAQAIKKIPKCPDGNYLVDGAVLPIRDTGGTDAITVDAKTVAIASGCEAKRGSIVRTRKGFLMRARWKECGSLERVRLRATIQKDCSVLFGSVVAKGVDEKSFVGIFDPKPPPELAAGQPVTAGVDCETVPAVDAIEALCGLLGVGPCVAQTSECRRYQRQLFTGSVLSPSPLPAFWNGRGGSGDLVADALVCSLRALSPEIDGPIVSAPTSIGLGALGDLSVRQEIGFTGFDRLRERFDGYRRVEVDMPVVGKAQAITQRFTVDKTALSGFPFAAGSYPLYAGYGVTVQTDDTTKILSFKTNGFTVETPLGPVTVSPEFIYGTRAAAIVAPYADGNLEMDPPPLYAGAGWYLRLFDLYGIDPGLANTATPAGPGTYQNARGGWSSEIGLGTRGTVLGQASWAPPAAPPITRPDDDLTVARSAEEALPSAYVSASAKVKWPSDPHQLLPSWVFQIPYLDPPFAQLTVEPRVQAGVGSQLLIAANEAADHSPTGEFDFESRRLSEGFLLGGATAAGLFSVDAGVRISVTADFPFIGSKTFVDVDKTFPIPLAGSASQGAVATAVAVSTDDSAPSLPASLGAFKPFAGGILGPTDAAAFLEQCYAPDQPAPQAVPETPPAPGNPVDLLKGAEWPCNICIYTLGHPQLDLSAIKLQYETARASHPELPPWPASIPTSWIQVLVPASTPPTWECDTYDNTGCYDLCSWDPLTQALTVIREPEDIVPLLPPTPDYDDERLLLNACDRQAPA